MRDRKMAVAVTGTSGLAFFMAGGLPAALPLGEPDPQISGIVALAEKDQSYIIGSSSFGESMLHIRSQMAQEAV